MTYSRHSNPHHPESALADYLQDLLVAQPEETSEPSVTWAEPPVLDPRVFSIPAPPEVKVAPEPEAMSEPELKTEPQTQLESVPEPDAEAELQPDPEPDVPAAESEPQMAAQAQQVRHSRWVDGRPEWAQAPFDCLLFSVGGLKLAVPLVLLGAVHPLDSDLTSLFGRPGWFMGLMTRGDRTVRVVDTAQWVMPDRYRSDGQAGYGFVIRLDNSEWGLACDEVAQSFRLKPDEVKWRGEDSRRPWLAGTVKNQMCALLDVGRFARMLAEAEVNPKLDLRA